ncbi:MAG: hypothetical protein LH472_05915 [Pyrinomonadaceae bacterium]|nr:hypothetical protein [Pyrinomonadaceae bacterium]
MSLYDLATPSNRSTEPVLIIKHSAQAANDDPQNTTVLSNSSSTSVIISPSSAMANDGGATPPIIVNVQPPEVKTALTKLARFIPTETITIYLGAVSAVAAIDQATKTDAGASADQWITTLFAPKPLYWIIGLIITPSIFIVIRAIEQQKIKKSAFSEFPYWKLLAAIISFLIWALAVPGNPYAESAAAKTTFAFVAIVVSIFLDLFDQYYEARKADAAAAAV